MGYQQDQVTPCGKPKCPGTKSTVFVYDDAGNCVDQQTYACSTCGEQ